jgi:hypothetical protein
MFEEPTTLGTPSWVEEYPEEEFGTRRAFRSGILSGTKSNPVKLLYNLWNTVQDQHEKTMDALEEIYKIVDTSNVKNDGVVNGVYLIGDYLTGNMTEEEFEKMRNMTLKKIKQRIMRKKGLVSPHFGGLGMEEEFTPLSERTTRLGRRKRTLHTEEEYPEEIGLEPRIKRRRI